MSRTRRIWDIDSQDEEYRNELKPCPICNKPVTVHGGAEEWSPTFYDPDSGGDPYSIECECGISFCIGSCNYGDFEDAWNNRKK